MKSFFNALLITSAFLINNVIANENIEEVIVHLQKNKIDYWTDEGLKNVIRIRKDGVRQVKIQDPDGHWIEINEAY